MTAFLDSNIIIAVTNPDDPWHEWSRKTLERVQAEGAAFICDIVYCEITMGLGSVLATDRVVEELALQRVANEDEALFRAGQAYLHYKQANRGSVKSGVLPDFLIGALADHNGVPLATANARDFVRHFPSLALIAPEP